MGKWKLIHADGHGGGGTYGGVATGDAAERWTLDPSQLQLYDLEASKSETGAHDLAAGEEDVVRSMVAILEGFWGVNGVGRSRPGGMGSDER